MLALLNSPFCVRPVGVDARSTLPSTLQPSALIGALATPSAEPFLKCPAGSFLSGENRTAAEAALLAQTTELKQARDAAAARAAEEEDAKAEQELDTTGISLGDKLLAKGLAPHGEVVFYEAVVLALRKRFPPLKARAAAFERMP